MKILSYIFLVLWAVTFVINLRTKKKGNTKKAKALNTLGWILIAAAALFAVIAES